MRARIVLGARARGPELLELRDRMRRAAAARPHMRGLDVQSRSDQGIVLVVQAQPAELSGLELLARAAALADELGVAVGLRWTFVKADTRHV